MGLSHAGSPHSDTSPASWSVLEDPTLVRRRMIIDLERIRAIRELIAAAWVEHQRAQQEMKVARIILLELFEKLEMAENG
jgi:hypothetical protein